MINIVWNIDKGLNCSVAMKRIEIERTTCMYKQYTSLLRLVFTVQDCVPHPYNDRHVRPSILDLH